MQSETSFPSSHQLKSYVASKSRLKLAARAVLSADAGLLVYGSWCSQHVKAVGKSAAPFLWLSSANGQVCFANQYTQINICHIHNLNEYDVHFSDSCNIRKTYVATVRKMYVRTGSTSAAGRKEMSLTTWACPCLLFQLLCTARNDHQETIQQCIDCLHCHCSHVHCASMTLASPQIHAQLNTSTAAARISTTACWSSKPNHSFCQLCYKTNTKYNSLVEMWEND